MKLMYKKIPYLIFTLFMFAIIPLFYYVFDNKSQILIYMLILIFPILCFTISFIYSYKNQNFSYLLAIIIGLFFIISCIVLWNFDLYVYAIGYILASLCGQGTGAVLSMLTKYFSKKK